MTASVTIYHNPRCSKSRATLALLTENGVEPQIVQYLETPPDVAALTQLLGWLGLEPRQLMRTAEPEYTAFNLADPNLSCESLIQAMIDHPSLIERPIVVANGKAVIGRPPENVLSIL